MADDEAAPNVTTPKRTAARKAAKKSARKRRKTQPRAQAPANAPVKSDLPYVNPNARIPELFARIQSAAVPQRVTFKFLNHLGFTSSNDRPFTSLLRKLGFTDSNAVPTDRYRAFRNPDDSARILGQAMRELYADLFAVQENIYERDIPTIRGVISRVTGLDQNRAGLIARTFKALADQADFTVDGAEPTFEEEQEDEPAVSPPPSARPPHVQERAVHFRHNIEIHLPATTDIAVYNAIFRSLREHLID